MNLPAFRLTKLFAFLIVLLALSSFTKFFSISNSLAGLPGSTKKQQNFKNLLLDGPGFIDVDYIEGVLNLCQYHVMEEEEIARRFIEWQHLILDSKSSTDLDKLEKVNRFFNQMEFLNDIVHWGKDDFWATPFEFIACQTGDCEDFAVAKYFTLYAMGVSEEKLSLTYVMSLKYNAHHMVLTYYSKPGAEPLILDNIIQNPIPASERSDLIPIYSINGTSLWIAEQRGRGKLAGNSNRIRQWQDLLKRMPAKRI